jgi:COP9 signalosome complex subunit 12
LSKNILRTLRSLEADMPAFSAYPRSHQVTFNYYAGVIHFLDEDYKKVSFLSTTAEEGCVLIAC